MDLQSVPLHEVLYVNFNQDFTCFVCGTETGFLVYNTDPLRLTSRRDFTEGGYGIVTMLYRTNITAAVGGGRNPCFEPRKVIIWDDRQSRILAELTFCSIVKAVRLRRDLVIVAIENKVYVYGFRCLTLLDSIETINPQGLCCVSTKIEKAALACPGMQCGHVLVVLYPQAFGDASAPPPREKTLIIHAHRKNLAAMTINSSGSMLATASFKGTIIRIYATATGENLHKFRRGAGRADIQSLTYSRDAEWLLVSSDKGTVHVFRVDDHSQNKGGVCKDKEETCEVKSCLEKAQNPTSVLAPFANLLPSYFSSEWSFAQFHVPDHRSIAAFGQDPHTVVVVCASGLYYKAKFDPAVGSEMVMEVQEYIV